jgi:chloramphenicol-sensitive protein RarD
MTDTDASQQARRGLWATSAAFFVWGLFPLYWNQLAQVPALQIMAHRIVWCAVFVLGYLLIRRGLGWLRPLAGNPRLLGMLALSSLLISVNWGLYIWAVNNGHVVESSLGYFINPLVSVLLGVLVLRERLNAWQWLAVGSAALGVAWLTWQGGRLPWIALTLAFSFGLYGLLRKLAAVESIPGLGVESGLLFLPALGFLLWSEQQGSGSFGHVGMQADALLIFGGVVTALPLIWFAYGARRIPLSLVGILQYIGPSLQLLIGVWIFREPFSGAQLLGFGCIWLALGIYAADGLRRNALDRRQAALQLSR